ncbi:MAG: CoA-binding protein [Elusimicrobiota bacterium]|nr:MAG: CoA-binding protein [Elusimicrobiota bacterium]
MSAPKRPEDGDACRLPEPNSSAAVDAILALKTFAVVGLSPKPERPSHYVSEYVMEAGYTVIPVNPGHKEILGRTCYPSVADIPGTVDCVVVFRRPEEAFTPILEAIAKKAKAVWLQDGVYHDEGERMAREAGLLVVSNDCLMRRLSRRR